MAFHDHARIPAPKGAKAPYKILCGNPRIEIEEQYNVNGIIVKARLEERTAAQAAAEMKELLQGDVVVSLTGKSVSKIQCKDDSMQRWSKALRKYKYCDELCEALGDFGLLLYDVARRRKRSKEAVLQVREAIRSKRTPFFVLTKGHVEIPRADNGKTLVMSYREFRDFIFVPEDVTVEATSTV